MAHDIDEGDVPVYLNIYYIPPNLNRRQPAANIWYNRVVSAC